MEFDIKTTTKTRILKYLSALEREHGRLNLRRGADQVLYVEPSLYPTEKPAHPNTLQGIAQFDRTLTNQTEIVRRNAMSVTGAKGLGDQFRTALASVKAKIDKAGADMNTAMTELHDTADTATRMVKQVEAESADLKAALGTITNGGPE